ncbi:cytochrome c biogenesis protein CcsA [Flavobacteriales bacterium]|nr:cytochrome c biogenesis protein CcsA [Flavobacteriales bacterium]
MEHTNISHLGYFLVFLSLVTAIFSAVSYFISHKNKNDLALSSLWKKSGRISFYLHSFALIGVVTLLYVLIYGHFYEFNYVWKYSNDSMPLEYLISCFWGGQEGSFLLWMFWNVVIGIILTKTAKKWESSVMSIFVLSQVFLNTMLLGIYVFDFKIGNNVFLLTRDLPENLGMPWTEMADYMKLPMFKDGQGLNPLLQNYWMTIHPPTLFLGFALTAVPFSYAIASLLENKWNEWIKPSLSWTFIGVGVLGIGILMGGMWAYESLSFGGFWAWDPVENVSYIPWLTFVGAGHLMLVNQRKNSSLFFTFILTFLSFILVLYSTFLTKSGVLGDSSVHSFTDNGMLGQLLVYILFFVWLSVVMMLKGKQHKLMFTVLSVFLFIMSLASDGQEILGMPPAGIIFILGTIITLTFIVIASVKYFPKTKTEDSMWSREFWMFMGSLFLLLACGQIFWRNSYPVWNMLFGSNDAGPENVLQYYNVSQGAFAVFVSFFVGFGQYLRYKGQAFSIFFKQIALSLIVSIALTVISLFIFSFKGDDFSNTETTVYTALLFTSIYAVIGNLDYFIRFLKGKLNFAGSSIAHIGFGLILFGALISNSQSKKLSHNRGGKFDLASLSETFENNEDVQITLGDTNYMREYFVAYRSRTQEGINIFYEVDYFEPIPVSYEQGDVRSYNGAFFEAKESHTVSQDLFLDNISLWKPLDSNENSIVEWESHTVGDKLFTLNPFVQINEKFGNVAEPSTKHFLGHDIFSHIKYPDPSIFEGVNNGLMPYENYIAEVGDSIVTTYGMVIVNSFTDTLYKETDKVGIINLTIKDYQKRLADVNHELYYLIKSDSTLYPLNSINDKEYGMKISLMNVGMNNLDESSIAQPRKVSLDITGDEFIIMQAKTFPLINLLWLGCIFMLVGSIMAVFYRVKRS